MMATARIMGRLIPRWGILNTLRMGMVCLLAGALLLCVGEVLVSTSVLGFIPPMWLMGVGIATAVSVAPMVRFKVLIISLGLQQQSTFALVACC